MWQACACLHVHFCLDSDLFLRPLFTRSVDVFIEAKL